jgi:hypothetical protein
MFSVVANPYCAPLDHAGRPCGAVLIEQPDGVSIQEWVGASLDREKTKPIGKPLATGELRSRHQHTVWKFSKEPVEVPETRYYRRLIQTGQLLAADLRTARKVGIKQADFVQPAELLKREQQARERERLQTYGDRLETAALDASDSATTEADRAEAVAKAAEAAAKQAAEAAKEARERANKSKGEAAAMTEQVRAAAPRSQARKGDQ